MKEYRRVLSVEELMVMMYNGTAPEVIECGGYKYTFDHKKNSYTPFTFWIIDAETYRKPVFTVIKEHMYLDKVEKKYLRNIVRPFLNNKYKVKISKRNETAKRQFISIVIKSVVLDEPPATLRLPSFEKDSMYEGLKPDAVYDLKELLSE